MNIMVAEEYGVCAEWKNNFLPFREWMYEHGYKDDTQKGKYTLDRINVNDNYSPENCRIISQKEQCSNRRNNIKVSINGVIHTIKQWSEITGISQTTLYYRYYRGIRHEKLIKK